MGVESNETEAERLNRNFDDLLQELRVSQNGTQILFAFLLTVPFTSRFKTITTLQQDVYFTTLLLAALSAAMLIAPAVMHRVLFHQQRKRELVVVAGNVALGGQALLTFAVAGAVFLVGDVVYGHTVGIATSLSTLAWWTSWFFIVPLWLRRRRQQEASTSST